MRNLSFLSILLFLNICFGQIADFSNINFKKADDNAIKFQGEGLENLPMLSYNLTHNLETDVEKFRAIYTWVCMNIKGDISQQNLIGRKRKQYKNDSTNYLNWNRYFLKTVFKKLIKHKKTMCTGYAYLIKELSFFANIECEIIDGYGRTIESNVEEFQLPNHSWNAVKINDKWYLCDATWSSGYTIGNFFVNNYNDGYFLTDPLLFSKNHFPLKKEWLLTNSTTEKTFVTSPLVYNETFQYKIVPLSPNKMSFEVKKGKELVFNYKTLYNNSNQIIDLISFIGKKEKKLSIYNLNKNSDEITFNYKFKNIGFYDIHLKIGDNIVASYNVHVTKS